MKTALLSAALIALCASPVQAGEITVSRAFDMQYMFGTITVEFAGKAVCELAVNEDCTFDAEPGKQRLGVTAEHTFKHDESTGLPVEVTDTSTKHYKTGYGCDSWNRPGNSLPGSCSGRLYVREVAD